MYDKKDIIFPFACKQSANVKVILSQNEQKCKTLKIASNGPAIKILYDNQIYFLYWADFL